MTEVGAALDSANLAPALKGPNVGGFYAVLNTLVAPFNTLSSDLQAALDIRAGVWDPSRPSYHLPTMERAYMVDRDPTMDERSRYRKIRLYTAARFSWGRWVDLYRVAGAAVDVEMYNDMPPPPTKARVFCASHVAVLLLAPEHAPATNSADLIVLSRAWVECIQDVAGWGILKGTPGELFTLDIGPGLDNGDLADVIAQGNP